MNKTKGVIIMIGFSRLLMVSCVNYKLGRMKTDIIWKLAHTEKTSVNFELALKQTTRKYKKIQLAKPVSTGYSRSLLKKRGYSFPKDWDGKNLSGEA